MEHTPLLWIHSMYKSMYKYTHIYTGVVLSVPVLGASRPRSLTAVKPPDGSLSPLPEQDRR